MLSILNNNVGVAYQSQGDLNSNQEVKMDLSNRAAGVYFVKIITNKGMKMEKVIKR
jgi:hypothetical protein